MSSAVFAASDGTSGIELWVTNGTLLGTFLLKDINPGAASGSPADFKTLADGRVLFNAYDATHGQELWITNGTAGGTSLVADIEPGAGGSFARGFAEIAPGVALFSATGSLGYELWVTNGTGAGTSLLKDINPGSASTTIGSITPLGNGRTVFSAYDPTHGQELWVTDGTAAGTSLLADIDPVTGGPYPASGSPGPIVALGNGRAVFPALNGTTGSELWVTDGTPAGTSMLQDIKPGLPGSYVNELTALGNGKAVFSADDGVHDIELWVTDGTAGGTSLLKDINTHPVDNNHYFNTSSYPSDIRAIGGGRAMMRANDVTHNFEPWVTDGTAAGTTLLRDIRGGGTAANDSRSRAFTPVAGGKVVFVAQGTDMAGLELWVTDLTEAGTSLLVDTRPGTSSGFSSSPPFHALPDGRALFAANNGTTGAELWVTDGTAGGTSLVSDIRSGLTGAGITGFFDVIPCFVAGTRILTVAGERAVEGLSVGDLVPTVSGRLRRVVWIGRTEIDLTRHREAWRAAPYRVRAEALGAGVPGRDLLLSPDHALAVDGALVPVRLLANGGSIAREAVARVTYLHVELDGHDVLLAEGAPAESFLDTGNRGQLDGTVPALHPDFSTRAWDEKACLPLLLGGERLASLRRKTKEESSFFEKKEAKKLLSV